MIGKVFSKEELYCDNKQKTYAGDCSAASFLLGGIGTGNVSLGARGELRNWQLFNEPGQLNHMPYSFFAIRAEKEGEHAVSKVLESKINPPYAQSQGFLRSELAGLPRFQKSFMKSEYPFVNVDLVDEDVPVEVRMEAFSPFIPLNADDSGIPGAYIRYYVKNNGDKPVNVSIAGSLANAVGFEKYDIFSRMKVAGNPVNEYRESDGIRGLYFSSENLDKNHIAYGNMALVTTHRNVTVKPVWVQGEWTDGSQDFWDDFIEDGKLEIDNGLGAEGCEWAKASNEMTFLHFSDRIGSICLQNIINPGKEEVFEFILSWYFPNRVKYWVETDKDLRMVEEHRYDTVKNHYACIFKDAWQVGSYLVSDMKRLEETSRKFSKAFYGSTLPGYVLEAIANNITIIRSPTCFRIEGGYFLGWEGVENTVGCGPGNCTHVWNYAQTAAYLFPELEQSMRRIEFLMETEDDGNMHFRARRIIGQEPWDMVPAADGQLGAVVRLYREWKLSGNGELIKECWDKAHRVVDYALKNWDKDGDFVLEGQQHVTYDTELYGVTSMVSSIFYAALKAVAEMAEYLGDDASADFYRTAFEKGSRKMDEICWNGEYYSQVLDDVDKYRYQYGEGCLSDQLLGQFMAHMAGLGYVLPREHVKSAALSIFRYNFLKRADEFGHVQRAYILNDEKGLTPCTWPKGGRPRFPFIYFGEVWTGIEYEVATLLFYEGLLDEGLTIVKAVRDRQDGYRRNPWSDNESGYYYARAMSSWGLLTSLSGFSCDQVTGKMSFDPKINKDNFKVFWCNGKEWGTYCQKKDVRTGVMNTETEILFTVNDAIHEK